MDIIVLKFTVVCPVSEESMSGRRPPFFKKWREVERCDEKGCLPAVQVLTRRCVDTLPLLGGFLALLQVEIHSVSCFTERHMIHCSNLIWNHGMTCPRRRLNYSGMLFSSSSIPTFSLLILPLPFAQEVTTCLLIVESREAIKLLEKIPERISCTMP